MTCLALLLLNACNVSDPPIIVASRFAEAVAQGDVKKAKSYCTTKTSVYLDMLYTINGVKPNESFNVMFTNESIHGERAFVYYRRNNNENDQNYLTLVLVGGVWKVDLGTRDGRSYTQSNTLEKTKISQVSSSTSSATHEASQTSQAKEVNEEAYSEIEEEMPSDNDITESLSSIPSSATQSSQTQSSSPSHMMVDGKYYDLKGDVKSVYRKKEVKSVYSKNRYDYDEDKTKEYEYQFDKNGICIKDTEHQYWKTIRGGDKRIIKFTSYFDDLDIWLVDSLIYNDEGYYVAESFRGVEWGYKAEMIYNENHELVKTIRNSEGEGDPFFLKTEYNYNITATDYKGNWTSRNCKEVSYNLDNPSNILLHSSIEYVETRNIVYYSDNAADKNKNFNESVGTKDAEKIERSVDKVASFPGGLQTMMNYLNRSIKYPKSCKDAGIQGRVTVSFVINKDGSIQNVEVVRGVHEILDAEAIRVVKSMPKWTPAEKNGQKVRSKYSLPINFSLNESSQKTGSSNHKKSKQKSRTNHNHKNRVPAK